MEAYRIERFGSVDGIMLRSSDDPRPGLREVLMRVRASSLNYRDLMVLKGGGRGPTKLGVIPLGDGAGEVAAMGEGVTRVKVGDRIADCFHPRWFGGRHHSSGRAARRCRVEVNQRILRLKILHCGVRCPKVDHLDQRET